MEQNTRGVDFFEENPEKRNVIDFFKYWRTDAILADLDTRRNGFSILCANIVGDMNLGTVIRNGNAFLSREVIIYGKKSWDRRGAVGTHRYSHFKRFKEVEGLEELKEYIKDFHIVGIDNIEGASPVHEYQWPSDKHVLMVFGEENAGIPKELLDMCHDLVYIKQLGSVRSLNVGVASGLSMYSYCQSIVYKE